MTAPNRRTTVPDALEEAFRRIRIIEAVPQRDIPAIVYGAIYNDGGIIEAGSGDWSVDWDAVNGYTITFDTPFGDGPIVCLTANNNLAAGPGGDYAYFVELSSRDVASIVVLTFDIDSNPEDGGFDFIAVGAL